jgi:hypothetical protein
LSHEPPDGAGLKIKAVVLDPLQGRVPLSRVVWVYGVLGSILYGCIELFLDPGNEISMRLYGVGGFLFSVYVTVAIYRCAGNCASPFWARMARISAVLSLFLLPMLAYLDWSGALSLEALGEM